MYALSYNSDIIFLSETFLDSSIEASDPNINISGYNSLLSDHPSNTERGGVRMFYKGYLPIIRHNDLCALSECIVTDIKGTVMQIEKTVINDRLCVSTVF